MRPTSADVAREAGVSRATVSYVLNDVTDRRITAQTRARVQAAAARLGYTSHPVAKTLKVGYSDVILVALPPWPLGPPVAEMITAASRAVAALGYAPLIHLEQPGSRAELARVCQEVQPVGVIAPSTHFRPGVLAAIKSSGTRAVIAYGEREVPGVPTLLTSQSSVGACAARYLLGRGHASILGVLPADGEMAAIGQLRWGGVRALCHERGAECRSVRAHMDPDSVSAALRRVLRAGKTTAVFAFNDECALMVVRRLSRAGYGVPADVAVIGCDDSPVAALVQPALTSVQFSITETWTSIIEVLQQLASGQAPGPARVFRERGWWHVSVVPRESA